MAMPDVLRALLTAHGPSGSETAPAAAFSDSASAFADVATDVMGSVTARVRGTAGGPALAVIGHLDEIGVIVTHVEDGGFLRIAGVGGWDPQILVGQRVVIATREGPLPGVIGRKPIHLLKDEDRKQVAKIDELHLDIGARDGDEARSLVRVGDVAVLAGDPIELPNGRLAARALDNRLGCYVAHEAARLVSEAGGAAGDVIAVGAVQEETTFGGATTSAFALRPDIAIVVDVTHATDAPGIDPSAIGAHALGSGPVIERGSLLHPRVTELLYEAAEAESIAFTVQAVARQAATDADAVHLSRAGVPTAGVSLPLRYMHSPVEVCQLSDIDQAAQLIAAFAMRLTAATDLRR